MKIKEKIIGIILIILGALPFLLKIDKISSTFTKYKFLTYLVPGEIIYQLAIIILGVSLIWTLRSQLEY
jgi:hypothetical protein